VRYDWIDRARDVNAIRHYESARQGRWLALALAALLAGGAWLIGADSPQGFGQCAAYAVIFALISLAMFVVTPRRRPAAERAHERLHNEGIEI
jgi:hypothetical protein